ncbi:MAG: hypothetical protein SGBAC_005608 [Bacillariaceae sp.]
MPGMLRGTTAFYFLPDWPDDADEWTENENEERFFSNLQEWIVNDAVTFCTIGDVYAIADSIEELCPKLHWIEIQNFYLKQFRTSPREQQQQQQQEPNSNNHQTDKDDGNGDGNGDRILDPLFHSLATLSQLTGLKLSSHPDYTPSVDQAAGFHAFCPPSFGIVTSRAIDSLITKHCNHLQHVTLSRLGLTDQHFQVIATSLPKLSVVETLDLNENAQTHRGTISILQALQKLTLSHQLMSLSIRAIDSKTASSHNLELKKDEMDFATIFPNNVALQYLETRTISLGQRISDSAHDGESDNESDGSSGEGPNQDHTLTVVEFWLHVNRMHRCAWGQITMSSLWPVLLQRLGKHSASAQWHCLQSFLPQMQDFR